MGITGLTNAWMVNQLAELREPGWGCCCACHLETPCFCLKGNSRSDIAATHYSKPLHGHQEASFTQVNDPVALVAYLLQPFQAKYPFGYPHPPPVTPRGVELDLSVQNSTVISQIISVEIRPTATIVNAIRNTPATTPIRVMLFGNKR